MNTQYTILRVWQTTARRLKILAALKDKSMLALIDQLVAEEFDRLKIPLPTQKAGMENKP
jgi:hypothetical protein